MHLIGSILHRYTNIKSDQHVKGLGLPDFNIWKGWNGFQNVVNIKLHFTAFLDFSLDLE